MKATDFIKVGVFPSGNRYRAYTCWYKADWGGCCEHLIPVEQRKDARKLAIAEHKERCVLEKE